MLREEGTAGTEVPMGEEYAIFEGSGNGEAREMLGSGRAGWRRGFEGASTPLLPRLRPFDSLPLQAGRRGSRPGQSRHLRPRLRSSKAEAQVVVLVVGRVRIAVRGTRVLRVVVPGAAAVHPLRARSASTVAHRNTVGKPQTSSAGRRINSARRQRTASAWAVTASAASYPRWSASPSISPVA